jgi:hypothetical protein
VWYRAAAQLDAVTTLLNAANAQLDRSLVLHDPLAAPHHRLRRWQPASHRRWPAAPKRLVALTAQPSKPARMLCRSAR